MEWADVMMKRAIKIINVVGARPNFMKIAPIMCEMRKNEKIIPLLVHTGQHYDEQMSKLFFDDLEIPEPDINLEVGSRSQAEQTAEIMKRFEPILVKERPDYILVVGDVNSTIACALTAVKLGIKIIHVEAGLRSFDRTMPEEINRVLTDAISDFLFITERNAQENLLKEGISKDKIHFVGNVMIDTLIRNTDKARQTDIHRRLGLNPGNQILPYGVLTLHRPSNVDDSRNLESILQAVNTLSKEVPIIFPAHPRTRNNIGRFGFSHFFENVEAGTTTQKRNSKGIRMIEPLGYLDFLHLMAESKVVLTDSGGMQEETTVLQIPCLTLRENTERPVTVSEGTNSVVGINRENIIAQGLAILRGNLKLGRIPELWDGRAAERIVKIILKQ